MPTVAVVNQKGGVGKTTTALNLGAALKEAGKRVLLVDLDPQANLTIAAGLTAPDGLTPTIGDLLFAEAIRSRRGNGQTLRDAILQTPAGLDLVPSNGRLLAAEMAMVSALCRELMLRALLQSVAAGYDYVLVDCSPSLGLLVINALSAADGVIIPVQADYLAIQGLGQVIETIAAVQERLNPDLTIYGLLLTLVDAGTPHAQEVVATIRQSFGGQVHIFDEVVRLHAALKDSARAGVSVLQLNGESEAARTYRNLASAVMAIAGKGIVIPPILAAAPPPPPTVEGIGSVPSPASPPSSMAVEPSAPGAPATAPMELATGNPSLMAGRPPAPGEPTSTTVGAPMPSPVPAADPLPPAAERSRPRVPLMPLTGRAAEASRQAGGVTETAAGRRSEPASAGRRFADFVARRPQWLGSDGTD